MLFKRRRFLSLEILIVPGKCQVSFRVAGQKRKIPALVQIPRRKAPTQKKEPAVRIFAQRVEIVRPVRNIQGLRFPAGHLETNKRRPGFRGAAGDDRIAQNRQGRDTAKVFRHALLKLEMVRFFPCFPPHRSRCGFRCILFFHSHFFFARKRDNCDLFFRRAAAQQT